MTGSILSRLLLSLIVCSAHLAEGQTLLPGTIETKNNTIIQCKILAGSRKKDRPFEYVETFDSLMGTKKFYPHQVKGYTCEDKRFESIGLKDVKSDKFVYVFAEQIACGKVCLFYTPIIDNMLLQVYFFKKAGEKYFHVFRSGEILDLGEGPYKIYAFNEETVFSRYFSQYFEDCEKVSKGCKNGFYTMQFIESLFKDYNTCSND